MSYTIQEQFLQGKTDNDTACEDFLVTEPNVVAVIDGATDKSGHTYAGVSSGRFAGQTIAKALPDLVSESSGPYILIENITLCLRQAIQDEIGDDDLNNRAMPSLTLLAYLPEQHVIIRVGDSPFMIDTELNTGDMKVDQATSMARSCFIELGLLSNDFSEEDLYTEDYGREYIMPLLQKQHLFANNQDSSFGYGVINGADVPKTFIEVIPTKGAKSIIMASDGYPDLKATLEDSENALKDVLEQDPLFFRKRYSTKGLKKGLISYDDRAYISLLLSNS